MWTTAASSAPRRAQVRRWMDPAPLTGARHQAARHRPHLRDPRRDVLHRFETSGPQQDFLVELRRLVFGGDPVHLPCCESDRGGRRDRQTDGTVAQCAPTPPPPSLTPAPAPRRPLRIPSLPGRSQSRLPPDLGAQSRWGHGCYSSGADPEAAEARGPATRLLRALPGRSGRCAPDRGAGSPRQPRACCAPSRAPSRRRRTAQLPGPARPAPRRSQGRPRSAAAASGTRTPAPGLRPPAGDLGPGCHGPGGPIPSRTGPRGRPASAGKLSKQIHHLLRLLPAARFKGISSYRVETRCHQAFTLWFHWLAPRQSI